MMNGIPLANFLILMFLTPMTNVVSVYAGCIPQLASFAPDIRKVSPMYSLSEHRLEDLTESRHCI
jgi:hypothetical protein